MHLSPKYTFSFQWKDKRQKNATLVLWKKSRNGMSSGWHQCLVKPQINCEESGLHSLFQNIISNVVLGGFQNCVGKKAYHLSSYQFHAHGNLKILLWLSFPHNRKIGHSCWVSPKSLNSHQSSQNYTNLIFQIHMREKPPRCN